MNFWEASLVFFGMVFSVGALAIFLEHLQKIATIKAQVKSQQQQDIQRKLEGLTQQIAELRQMHAEHVLNTDDHLKHLEYKLSTLENRIEQIEQQPLRR